METPAKSEKILDALQELLQTHKFEDISVSDIAQKAGIGKGSIYYYFSSKDAIFDALVERHYKKALETAKNLAEQTDIPVFTRMATLFQACRNSSFAFLIQSNKRLCEHETKDTSQEYAYLIHKFLEYTIAELMPSLTAIIEQGIANGDIHFDYPKELAKIVLIVLSVVLANGTISTSPTEIEQTIHALISLLEKGTETPPGSLDYLINF